MISNTPAAPSGSMTYILQILATHISKYHESILPRAKMNIFAQGKCASLSEFECNYNALVFEAIGHELSEVHELYNMLHENGNSQLALFCDV